MDISALFHPPVTYDDHVRYAARAEDIYTSYIVWLVEVKRTVQVASAQQYVRCVQGAFASIIPFHFNLQAVHPPHRRDLVCAGLTKLYPHVHRRRDPVLQQHILRWARVLDLTNHEHRLFLTLSVVLWSTASRVADVCPPTSASFDPHLHATRDDVRVAGDTAYLRLTDHKTAGLGTPWQPKPMPQPVLNGNPVAFPLRVDNVVYHSLGDLANCTSHALPDSIQLSAYFQLERLQTLRPQGLSAVTASSSSLPLFQHANGSAVSYSSFSANLRKVCSAAGTPHIYPHSHRVGGATAASAHGADEVTLKTLGYWLSQSSVLRYNRTTHKAIVDVVHRMTDEPHTDMPDMHVFDT